MIKPSDYVEDTSLPSAKMLSFTKNEDTRDITMAFSNQFDARIKGYQIWLIYGQDQMMLR